MPTNDKLVDHLFRHQYGRMVAILTRLFGFDQIEVAEDLVQESFIKALSSWKIKGLPDNPEGWLMQTAKHLAIDYFRKQKVHSNYLSKPANQQSGTQTISINNLFLENEIEDAQLRMIFTCCHPLLKFEDQIALTLQVVSGFGLVEIAAALLLNKEVVKKRIQRAKKKLKTEQVKLEIPVGKDLAARLPVVEKVVYLIFNEGYSSNKSEQLIRKELCFEALRLGRIITEHKILGKPSTLALMGLMCFHAARFESRLNASDEIILFAEQDRSKWNQELFLLGNFYMDKAVVDATYSSYHYQAAIVVEYMKADLFQKTDWEKIIRWYDCLIEIEPSPFHKLNQAVVQLYAGHIATAQQNLDLLDPLSLAKRRYLWHSVQAQLFLRTGKKNEAIDQWLEALKLAPTIQEKRLIEQKMAKID